MVFLQGWVWNPVSTIQAPFATGLAILNTNLNLTTLLLPVLYIAIRATRDYKRFTGKIQHPSMVRRLPL
jgi:hypothetical protein